MRNALLIFSALLLLSACASSGGSSGTTGLTADISSGDATDVIIRAPAYRLGSGDQLRIIVFGEESLSGEFVVDGEGMVSMPLIGEVEAEGLTLAGLRTRIESRLADGYLADPRVSAEVLNFRPFYILGEVQDSGEYPYTAGLTVMNAVARAGGFTYRANTRTVFIQRDGTDVEVEIQLTPTLVVMPGDTIRIGERFF